MFHLHDDGLWRSNIFCCVFLVICSPYLFFNTDAFQDFEDNLIFLTIATPKPRNTQANVAEGVFPRRRSA